MSRLILLDSAPLGMITKENGMDEVIIATSNVKHLNLFANAIEWEKV